ncbi:uncharacterized protein LOC127000276 isoform X2 [Eriocheir sinensis]|nr:uncharacterized protein LOC127000276 isoform X2 [Eriocheir sinensis]
MQVSVAISCVVAVVLLAAVPAAALKCFRCSSNCDASPGTPMECSGGYDTCLYYNFPGLSERACWQKKNCDIKAIIDRLNPHEWSRINATLKLTPTNKDQVAGQHMSCCDTDLCNPAATAAAQPLLAILLPLGLYTLLA